MKYSVRRRLLVTLLSATIVVWTATAVVSYYDARTEVYDLFDAQLAQAAQVLMSLVEHEMQEELREPRSGGAEKGLITELEEHLAGHRYEKKVAFQIWVGRDRYVFRSPQAPEVPLSTADSGFSNETVGNHRWRVVTLSEQGGLIRVQVGERFEIRRELIHRITLRLLAPLIIGLPLLALLIWVSVGRSLAPFSRLARDIAARDPSSLQPVGVNPIPVEAKPLVTALNALFARLRQAFEREKRLTADAAHELRTPLAGLRMQAEVAQRATDKREKHNALSQLIKGVDRTTHLVEQLLTMARLDPDIGLQDFQTVDLREIVTEVLAELSNGAIEKKIDIELRGDEPTMVRGNADGLRVLVRNLVDNAIRYTPHNGEVAVSIVSTGNRIELTVSDSGPGIAADEREQVFERFYRGHESPAGGSGLGLSIVRRIAALHDASVILGAPAHGGLEVRVVFQGVAAH
ncbi:MAG: ATP-binding protein [Acidiferrobacterales bacterium]|nr:ATP-binding protein [Acidiferrobacterales bacterium]